MCERTYKIIFNLQLNTRKQVDIYAFDKIITFENFYYNK